MDDAFGDSFMVEMENLLAQNKIFQQDLAARACLELVLVVGNPYALAGGQAIIVARLLMPFLATSRGVVDCVLTGHVGHFRADCDMVHSQRIRREKVGPENQSRKRSSVVVHRQAGELQL